MDQGEEHAYSEHRLYRQVRVARRIPVDCTHPCFLAVSTLFTSGSRSFLSFAFGVRTSLLALLEQRWAVLYEYALQFWVCYTLGWLAYNDWVAWMESLQKMPRLIKPV
jgi:hypothetical protein